MAASAVQLNTTVGGATQLVVTGAVEPAMVTAAVAALTEGRRR